MPWLRIDDRFEEHEKVEALSDAAHRLWFRAAGWCKRAGNLKLRGFLPHARALELCAGSAARLERLATELVEARGEPCFGHVHGLWERRANGWQFHDWDRNSALRARWSTAGYTTVFQRDPNACRYCGSSNDLTVDHVVPRCQGGGDDPANLVLACRRCNGRKGGRTPEQAGMVLQ